MMNVSRTQFASIKPDAHVHTDDLAMKEERLPFTIRVVRNAEELKRAVHIRHEAYMRHVPTMAKNLIAPESADSEDGVVVLLAESKFDGSPIGTMRIQINEFKPLTLEQSVALPAALSTRRLAEATRLGVSQERVGRIVTTALFKAFFLYCALNRVEWMVIAARSPVDRQYDRLLFADVYPEMGYIPLQHASNIPHRVMSLKVSEVEERWAAAQQGLFNFFFKTFHEDINVSGTSLYQAHPASKLISVLDPMVSA